MPSLPEGVPCPHDHRVLVKEIPQLCKGKKAPLLLVGLQPPVQLQDILRLSDGQDVAALRNVRLHAREDAQPVTGHQGVPLPLTGGQQIAVELVKLQRVKMLGETEGMKSRPAGLPKEPVCVNNRKRQLFCQFPVGVKIYIHLSSFFLPLSFMQVHTGLYEGARKDDDSHPEK